MFSIQALCNKHIILYANFMWYVNLDTVFKNSVQNLTLNICPVVVFVRFKNAKRFLFFSKKHFKRKKATVENIILRKKLIF